jgi:hypothetical protein
MTFEDEPDEDVREELVMRLLMEFQQTEGATTDEQAFAFKAGARAALYSVEAALYSVETGE